MTNTLLAEANPAEIDRRVEAAYTQIKELFSELGELLPKQLARMLREQLPAAAVAHLKPNTWENGIFLEVAEIRDRTGEVLWERGDDLDFGTELSTLECDLTDTFSISCGDDVLEVTLADNPRAEWL